MLKKGEKIVAKKKDSLLSISFYEVEVDILAHYKLLGDDRIDGFLQERKLMLAVLNDALSALQKGYFKSITSGRKTDADIAYEWIKSDDEISTFSFNSICHELRLNAEYLRSGIERYVLKRSEGRIVINKKKRPRIVPLKDRFDSENLAPLDETPGRAAK